MNNLERFLGLLDVHGSNLDSWKKEDIAWARNLIATDTQARAAYDEHCTLDKMLTEHIPHTLSDDLVVSITDRIAPRSSSFTIWNNWMPGSLWRPVFAATLPLIIGILVGVYYPQEPTTSAESIALLAFSDIAEEYQQEYRNEE